MKIHVNLGADSYDITVKRGSLNYVTDFFNLRRRVMIVTDSGTPSNYASTVTAMCTKPVVVTIPNGEQSKSSEWYFRLLSTMLNSGLDRGDCVVAVGGGVVGDLAGFAAATYMRGIDFYNIPTTLLSAVDSSIGGKTAINLNGVKNIVGAFHQPCGVLVDPNVLTTLPQRQLSAGWAEIIKMAMTSDKDLFESLENTGNLLSPEIDDVIIKALSIKKTVVEKDERECGIRKILNFGHTIGHAIESAECGRMLHGECVALGMLPMCGADTKTRLLAVLRRFALPTSYSGDFVTLRDAIAHDKKTHGESVTIVTVNTPGHCNLEDVTLDSLYKLIKQNITGNLQ